MAGLYIHIPFCKSRCIYCDFFSSVSFKEKELYVDALCKEIGLQKDFLENQNIETIYFGGGTPSLLTAEDFHKIFVAINRVNTVLSSAEITLEANPDDIDSSYLKSISTLPFNRISLGVQSFRNKDLLFMGRRHDAFKAIEAVKICRSVGFKNISIDLIYGLPEQTLAEWKENLDIALSLNVEHISAYHLIYEEGTKLHQLLRDKRVREIDEELSLEMFSEMIHRLKEAGFIHYEISNFGLPGYFSKHNSSYWTGKHYLGIGASAHSYNGIFRQYNIHSIADYITEINQGNIPAEKEIMDENAAYNDYIITGLRTMWGIDLLQIKHAFGEDKKLYCLKQSQKYIDSRDLLVNGDILTLSDKGVFLSDGIMSDLMFVP